MDAENIAALVVAIGGLVSFIVAGIVACCRKQTNAANQSEQNNSEDSLEITVGAHTRTTKKMGDETNINEEFPAITIVFKAKDIGNSGIGASNDSTGYDEDPIKTDNRVTTTAAAIASSTTTTPTSNTTNVAAAAATVSHPVPVDDKLFAKSPTYYGSTLQAGEVNIAVPGGVQIIIKNFNSTDNRNSVISNAKTSLRYQPSKPNSKEVEIEDIEAEAIEAEATETTPLLHNITTTETTTNTVSITGKTPLHTDAFHT